MKQLRFFFLAFFLLACGTATVLFSPDGGPDGPLDATIDSPSDTPLPKDTGPDGYPDDVEIFDSGFDVDASDASIDVTCGAKTPSTYSGMGICGSTEEYKCNNGLDKYVIDCECPSTACICEKNNITVNTINNIAGCGLDDAGGSTCNFSFSFATMAMSCGFPY
jgi:hypothetical protein